MSKKVLLVADRLALSFPAFTPRERQLMSNPISFLSDFYFSRSAASSVKVLDGITFSLSEGQRLGILGHNGAGKSTLLRLLAGIYHPTGGNIEVRGTAKGLFDVGLGMNANATGLENIYLRGLQMGISLGEIKRKLPLIAEFTELEDEIHKIYDTYSTGMRLRLAFAISTMISPDILLMDEWLGAGDIRFRSKVKERMEQLVDSSSSLILASHNNNLLESFCTHGLVLSKGRQIFFGDLGDAISFYKKTL